MSKQYSVMRLRAGALNPLPQDDAFWQLAEVAEIDYFHPDGSSHRPQTTVRMLYNDHGIFILFRVRDRYVHSLHTQYNAKVHEDSCVECFLNPPDAEGYYNFEINAGATLHVNYIIDPERGPDGKRKNICAIPEALAKTVKITGSLPAIVNPEIREPLDWSISVFIPFGFFALYSPFKDPRAGEWSGNFYKCADKCSHPHWASWNPVSVLNFHRTDCFGRIRFKD